MALADDLKAIEGHWSRRAPASLLDEGLDALGNPDPTGLDRRWLWRLESFLSINGTNLSHRMMGGDLRQYLNETCEHHWISHEADPAYGIGPHRQCSWCYTADFDVELGDSNGP